MCKTWEGGNSVSFNSCFPCEARPLDVALGASLPAGGEAATLCRASSFIWGFYGQVPTSRAEPTLCPLRELRAKSGQRAGQVLHPLLSLNPLSQEAALPQTSFLPQV